MTRKNSFEELDAWQKARAITNEIYELTATGTFSEDFSLKDQIKRAATSIMSNIAEGHGRASKQEFIRFLAIAKGSASETQSQLYTAFDQDYITEEEFNHIYDELDHVSRQLKNLMKYLRNIEEN